MFFPTDDLACDEIVLRLEKTGEADPARKWVPAYYFAICLPDGTRVGSCDLRIGHNEKLYIGGNIGYRIEEPYRGHRYAAKACRLLFRLAKKHELGYVIITCDPENAASNRTCQLAGGRFIETAVIPEDNEMYAEGKRLVNVWRFEPEGMAPETADMTKTKEETELEDNKTTFMKLAGERYSVRKYLDRPVPEELVEKILEAARLAPTGCNNQPQRIIVLQSRDALEKLKECTRCHFDAPLAFIIGYDRRECWYRPYDGKASGDIDASIVTTHMMLEAAQLGLGSCWVMHYRPAVLKEKFAIDENIETTALLTVGYPAQDSVPAPGHTAFRPMEEIVTRV